MKRLLALILSAVIAISAVGCSDSTNTSVTSSNESITEQSSAEESTPEQSSAEESTSEQSSAEESSDGESSAEETSRPEFTSRLTDTTMRDITTMELVRDMGLGINLGNTFEACGSWIYSGGDVSEYEKAWGSPIITREIIEGYKIAGFDSIRIPVAWSNKMDKETYTISPEYLARVKEVVEWALDSDLYVILNIHWDGGWFEDFAKEDKRDEAFKKYETIWTQLSEAFKDYGDYLIFESLNEEGGWEELWNRWSNEGDKELSYGILNDMNSRFVNIVRASGGNNQYRHLLIAGYNTDIELTCDPMYKLPEDEQNRMAVSVHYYTPSTFTILEEDASWGKMRKTWGTDADMKELAKYMDMLKTTFVDNGIPVIVGEYGTTLKNKDPNSVELFFETVCREIYSRGMCPVVWDVTDVLYNRTTCKFNNEGLRLKMMAAKEAR